VFRERTKIGSEVVDLTIEFDRLTIRSTESCSMSAKKPIEDIVVDRTRFDALERLTRIFRSDDYFYKLCGVGKHDHIGTLKMSRNAFLKNHHPDKVDDFSLDLFMETTTAFKVLMNAESRRLYDKNGKKFRKRLGEFKNNVEKTMESFEKDGEIKNAFQKMIKNTFR
jgi:hypothetical protein